MVFLLIDFLNLIDWFLLNKRYTYSEDKFSDGYMGRSYLVPASGLSLHSQSSVLCGTGILNFIKTNLSFFSSFIIWFLWTVSGVFEYLKHLKTAYILSWKVYYDHFIFISMIHLKLNFYPCYLRIFSWPSTIYWKDYFLYNKLQWSSHHQTWTSSHHAWVLSRMQLFVTPWIATHQAPLSMGFSRQRYWTGLQFSSPEDLPDPGMEPMSLESPTLAGVSFTAEPPGISMSTYMWIYLRTLCCVFLICISILAPIFL